MSDEPVTFTPPPSCIPAAILRLYAEKYIVYSAAHRRVLGIGNTEAEAREHARASGIDGEWQVGVGFPLEEDTSARETLDKLSDFLPLPSEITRLYPGKYLVFSEEEKRVIGVGDTEEEAFAQAEASGVKGLWHIGYASHPDELIL